MNTLRVCVYLYACTTTTTTSIIITAQFYRMIFFFFLLRFLYDRLYYFYRWFVLCAFYIIIVVAGGALLGPALIIFTVRPSVVLFSSIPSSVYHILSTTTGLCSFGSIRLQFFSDAMLLYVLFIACVLNTNRRVIVSSIRTPVRRTRCPAFLFSKWIRIFPSCY